MSFADDTTIIFRCKTWERVYKNAERVFICGYLKMFLTLMLKNKIYYIYPNKEPSAREV